MAAGDVTATETNATAAALDTALTAIRASAGANGKYGVVSVANGTRIIVWGIEEA